VIGLSQDVALQNMLYNGLLRYKPGDISEIQLDLAEKYEISKDGMSLTFYMRKGVMTRLKVIRTVSSSPRMTSSIT